MRLSLQSPYAKILAAAAAAVFVVGAAHWLRTAFDSRVDESLEEGEFLLVAAADRSFDGAPALALTFTLPLDARKDYDPFIRVFEMPPPPQPAANRPVFDDDGAARQGGSTVVSTEPEDTNNEGGSVVTGAWVVGENPRLLFFPHIKPETRYVVEVSPGILARNGSALESDARYSIRTAAVPPAYYFASNGIVLPARQNGGLPVITVNVPEVDVQFLRVKDENLPEFLDRVIRGPRPARAEVSDEDTGEAGEFDDYASTSLKGAVGYYQLDQFRNITESVYIGRFTTEAQPNKQSVTYLPVEEIKELKEPGIYVAAMSQPGRFRYDQQTTYFYVSDLGMHLRLFEKTADVFVSSLVDAKAVRGVEVSWLDSKGKVLVRVPTDGEGHAQFSERPADGKVLLARRGNQVSLIALKEPALDLSEYDITGAAFKPVHLFAYTGRDLYRPGEGFDVSILARDADGRPVPAQPVQAILKNPLGRRQFTSIWQPDSRFEGYFLKRIELPPDAATGFWTLELRADPGDRIPSTVFRFGVEEFLPERMKLDLTSAQQALSAGSPFVVEARGAYLYGAPAAGNRLLGVVEFERNKNPLTARYPGFEFGDVKDNDARQRKELQEQTLDAGGTGRVEVDLSPIAANASPFTVRTTLSLLETGGRPVVRNIERTVWPAEVLVGVRPLFAGEYARERSTADFEVLRADREGNLRAGAAMPVRVFFERREYYWRFEEQRGWHSGFTETDELIQTSTVTVPAGGRGKLSVPVRYGRYRIEILDRETNQTLRYRFYAGWSARSDDTQGMRPDRVVMKLDKAVYREGETARLTMTPPNAGEALVTVEGDRTLWVKRMAVSAEETTLDIPIGRDWQRHDLYVSVLALRPGSEGNLVTPARALGIVHLPLDRAARALNVTLEAPERIRPETDIRVKVKAPEARGQKAFVTLAAVDAGILNITRFQTPDPVASFFGKLRYGAEPHDVYGRLIEKMEGRKGQLKYGGDNTPGSTRGLPKIVQLVDLFSGPVMLNEQGEADIPLRAPDFNGTLRLMAVVAASDRFGSKEAEMVVAAPLITELLTPRFLSFGDRAVVALDLQNLSGRAQQLDVSLAASEALRIQEPARSLALRDQEKRTLRFPIEAASDPGVHTITVKVDGQDIRIQRSFPLSVEAPTPQVQFARRYTVRAGESVAIQDAGLSGLHRSSMLAHVTVSDKPPIDIRRAVQDLLTYPYGCGEQLTSTAYPHLFIDEDEARRLGLKAFTREQRVEMVERAISRLGANQVSNGGFSLWGNASEYEYWLSAYITNFLADAREQGFPVPDAMYDRGMDFLLRGLQEGVSRLPTAAQAAQNAANNSGFFRERDNGRFDVLAYGAYVLARDRKAPVAALRQMHDLRAQSQTGLSLVELGVALTLMGDPGRGSAAIGEGVQKSRGAGYYWYDYGTVLRDAALSYALLVRHEMQAAGRENLLAVLSSELERSRYFSTQEKMALFLAGRSLTAGGDTWTASLAGGARPEPVSRSGSYFREVSAAELASGLTLANTSKGNLYVELSLTGNPIQQPPARGDAIELSRLLYTPDGKPLAGRTLKVGDIVMVRLRIRPRVNLGPTLVVDKIPAGLEIENLNIVRGESLDTVEFGGVDPADAMSDSLIKHVEFRDDRFVAALRPDSSLLYRRDNGALNLFYRARVVTPGDFIVPPLYAEDMYRPNIFGLAEGGTRLSIADADAAR